MTHPNLLSEDQERLTALKRHPHLYHAFYTMEFCGRLERLEVKRGTDTFEVTPQVVSYCDSMYSGDP